MYWYQYLAQNNDWWCFFQSIELLEAKMRTRKLTSPLSLHRHQLLQRYLYQEHQGTSWNFIYWNSHNLSHVSFRTPRSSKVKMNSDQYIVTVFSFKKSKNSKVVPDMESSFNSSVSTNYGPPLDYSFRNISSLEKLERHRPPRQSLRKQVIHWSKSNQSLALQILKLSTV